MRALFWIFVLVVAVVLALFAVSNRAAVGLGLWPLPYLVEAPLYLVVLLALLVGLVLGGFGAWIGGRRWRRETRRRGRRIAALEVELAAKPAMITPPPPVAALPALPR